MRCHVEGGLGPMAFTSYDEVRPWAPMIRQEVAIRHMPPWGVDPTVGIQAYKNNIALSEDEIDLIVRWADAGAPEGDPADLPPPPPPRRTDGTGLRAGSSSDCWARQTWRSPLAPCRSPLRDRTGGPTWLWSGRRSRSRGT